jgi:citrate synthase
MSYEKEYIRGLRDVAACQTHLSFVDSLGALYYVGYDLDRLVGRVSYEEVIHLLLFRKLPDEIELDALRQKLFSEMKLPKQIIKSIKESPATAHPIELLRTSISQLGEYDENPNEFSEAVDVDRAISLVAKVPTLVSAIYRIRNNKKIVDPKNEYRFSENFLYMFRGKPANEEEKDAIDRYMILHADHGLNASTFAARVTASTLSDVYSSVLSAVGALRGRLHGGASERVMRMLSNVNNVKDVEDYIQGLLFDGKKIMGFGHRVYTVNDPRSRHLRKISKALCQQINEMELYYKARQIQNVVHKEKRIFPNVDFYAAVVLSAMGIPKEYFTLFFASSRITGWVSHILEQYSDSVLLRPTSRYIGAYGTRFVPIDKR